MFDGKTLFRGALWRGLFMLCKFHPESPDSFCHQVWPQMWRQVSVKMRISVATVGAVALIHWSVVVRRKGDERCERVTRIGFKPFAFPIFIIPLVVSIRFVAYIQEDSPLVKFPWGRLRFRVKRSDIRKITFWQSVAGEHSVGVWAFRCSIFSVDITLTELGLTKWMEVLWVVFWLSYCTSILRAGHSTKKELSQICSTERLQTKVAHVMFLYLAMLRREGVAPLEEIYV